MSTKNTQLNPTQPNITQLNPTQFNSTQPNGCHIEVTQPCFTYDLENWSSNLCWFGDFCKRWRWKCWSFKAHDLMNISLKCFRIYDLVLNMQKAWRYKLHRIWIKYPCRLIVNSEILDLIHFYNFYVWGSDFF